MADYLVALGFQVDYDCSKQQIGASCGVVAARVALDLHACADWLHQNVQRAVDQEWITRANIALADKYQEARDEAVTERHRLNCERKHQLFQRLGEETCFISESDVHHLATVWSTPIPEVETAGPPCHRCGGDHATAACDQYPMPRLAVQPSSLWLEVSSLDFIGRKVCDDLHACATGGLVLPLALRISNTETSDSRGYHWFTVAYSIEPE